MSTPWASKWAARWIEGFGRREYHTFGDTVKVGWACDEQQFLGMKIPFVMAAFHSCPSQVAPDYQNAAPPNRTHARSLEPHIDFAIADATDYVRGDVGDHGITGVIKVAHACEALGIDIEFHGPGPAQRQCMASICI